MILLIILFVLFLFGTIAECCSEEYQYQKLKKERKDGKRL